MLLSIGYGVVTTFQIRAGAGARLTGSPSPEFIKDTYISEIFYVVSLYFAKMIILQILLLLSRNSARRIAVYTTMAFTAIWAVAMTFAVAFQCTVPRSWNSTSADCFNQSSFWAAFAAFDALVDMTTGALSVLLFYDMNMSPRIKIPVIVAFASRIFLVPIIVLRLIYQRMALRSHDRPYDDFAVVLLTSAHVNIGIVLTCLPFLKPVISGAQSGILAGDIRSLGTLDADYLFTRSKRSKLKSERRELDTVRRRPVVTRQEEQRRGESQEQMVIRQTTEVDVSSSSIGGSLGEIESARTIPRLG
ncbi:hypothetical protein N0V90_008345 [Kalmusia sp. IMI 367209]|nr:hypothetical protein N0V90_008345 [Kalmusia sp. IMI 367209]